MFPFFLTTTIHLHSTPDVSTTDVHNSSTHFSFIRTFLQNTLSDDIQPSLFAAIGVLYDPQESVEKTSVEKTSVDKTSVGNEKTIISTSFDKQCYDTCLFQRGPMELHGLN